MMPFVYNAVVALQFGPFLFTIFYHDDYIFAIFTIGFYSGCLYLLLVTHSFSWWFEEKNGRAVNLW
jgi:hypothetical protein